MDLPAPIYIILLLVVIIGPVLANIAYNGWKNAMLSRIFLLVSAVAMITLIVMVLTEV